MEDDATGFEIEPAGVDYVWRQLSSSQTPSPKVWKDAYLAAFAIAGGMRLVTLDGDFRNFESMGLDLLLLAP
jgi:predicted nucleic acid-binding protein